MSALAMGLLGAVQGMGAEVADIAKTQNAEQALVERERHRAKLEEDVQIAKEKRLAERESMALGKLHGAINPPSAEGAPALSARDRLEAVMGSPEALTNMTRAGDAGTLMLKHLEGKVTTEQAQATRDKKLTLFADLTSGGEVDDHRAAALVNAVIDGKFDPADFKEGEGQKLLALMRAAGIDPKSPQGQKLIQQALAKETTHPSAATINNFPASAALMPDGRGGIAQVGVGRDGDPRVTPIPGYTDPAVMEKAQARGDTLVTDLLKSKVDPVSRALARDAKAKAAFTAGVRKLIKDGVDPDEAYSRMLNAQSALIGRKP